MPVSENLRRRIHQEHRTLRILQEDLLDKFETFCEEPTAQHQAEVVQLFSDFSDSVRRHFAFEEEEGYLGTVTVRRPHHQAEVDRLLAQHTEISDVINKLHDDLKVDLPEDDKRRATFRKDFVDLITVLGRHEQGERELIMEAFWLEGGYSS